MIEGLIWWSIFKDFILVLPGVHLTLNDIDSYLIKNVDSDSE